MLNVPEQDKRICGAGASTFYHSRVSVFVGLIQGEIVAVDVLLTEMSLISHRKRCKDTIKDSDFLLNDRKTPHLYSHYSAGERFMCTLPSLLTQ